MAIFMERWIGWGRKRAGWPRTMHSVPFFAKAHFRRVAEAYLRPATGSCY
jgi:hypothetical protein